MDNYGYVWTYGISNKCWSQVLRALNDSCSLVVINGLPTTVGGYITNKLMSLTTKGEWTEKFPPMPTKRYFTISVCTETILIVVGGIGMNTKELTTVEVLNIESLQWSTAVDLPEPMRHYSATVCGDQLYMLGGQCTYIRTTSAYTCSVSALLQTCTQKSSLEECTSALALSNGSSGDKGVWSKLADLPVIESTCVTFCGQLVAVGGSDSDNKPTTAVHMYNQATNSWNVISHMTNASCCPLVAVLPVNQLMVVGGMIEINDKQSASDSVEFGNLC